MNEIRSPTEINLDKDCYLAIEKVLSENKTSLTEVLNDITDEVQKPLSFKEKCEITSLCKEQVLNRNIVKLLV